MMKYATNVLQRGVLLRRLVVAMSLTDSSGFSVDLSSLLELPLVVHLKKSRNALIAKVAAAFSAFKRQYEQCTMGKK